MISSEHPALMVSNEYCSCNDGHHLFPKAEVHVGISGDGASIDFLSVIARGEAINGDATDMYLDTQFNMSFIFQQLL